MTKKELNAIRHAGYLEWTKGEEAKRLLESCNNTIFLVYRVSEGEQVKLFNLTDKRQMNHNFLVDNGFSDDARIELLFTANRQTKTLSM